MPASQGTLVYDGDCGFCTTSAKWIEGRLGDDVAAFSDPHSLIRTS